MSYKIQFSKNFFKDFDNLDSEIKKRVLKKIKYFADSNKILKVFKKLQNFEHADYRFRIGDYRLLFEMDNNIVTIIKIDHRKDTYK